MLTMMLISWDIFTRVNARAILPSMNIVIEAIDSEWFHDDVTPRGVSFDSFFPQACKVPLGNMQSLEQLS